MVIGHQLLQIATKHQWKADIADKVLSQILKSPSQSYLWVRLILDEIEKTFFGTSKKLLALIATLPESAEAAYEKILSTCEHPREARVILAAVLTAVRPLSIQEMWYNKALIRRRLPFIQYSAEHWIHHAARSRLGRGDALLCASICDEKVNGYLMWSKDRSFGTPRLTRSEIAILTGLGPVVQVCLESLDDINAQNEIGNTVLMVATMEGSASVVDRLLQAGADPGIFNHERRTALSEAVMAEDIVIARLLLRYEADINAKTGFGGQTALHLASGNGKYKMARFLLKHGAAVNEPTKRVRSTAMPSTQNRRPYGIFTQTSLPDIPPVDGMTALHLASHCGLLQVVEVLLQHDVSVEATTSDHNTALHITARRGYTYIMRLLLQHGADVNAFKAPGHRTALMEAVIAGKDSAVRLLLESGANIDIGNVMMKTILRGGVSMLRTLLDHAQAMEALTLQPSTSLQVIRKEGLQSLFPKNIWNTIHPFTPTRSYDMVYLLLSIGTTGASVQENRRFLTITVEDAFRSRKHRCIEVIELMLKKWDNLDLSVEDLNVWKTAWSLQNEQLVLLLIKGGIPIESIAQSMANGKEIFLLQASYHGWRRMVELLWNDSADIDMKINTGENGQAITPLFAAANRGHVMMVEWLIEHGADVNAQIENHGTVLQAMIRWVKLDEVDRENGELILQTLIRAGAEIHFINNDLTTVKVLQLLQENESSPWPNEARSKRILACIPGPSVPDVSVSVLRNMQLEWAISLGELDGIDSTVEEAKSHYWSVDVDDFADETFEDWEDFHKAVNGDDQEEEILGQKTDVENDDDTT